MPAGEPEQRLGSPAPSPRATPSRSLFGRFSGARAGGWAAKQHPPTLQSSSDPAYFPGLTQEEFPTKGQSGYHRSITDTVLLPRTYPEGKPEPVPGIRSVTDVGIFPGLTEQEAQSSQLPPTSRCPTPRQTRDL